MKRFLIFLCIISIAISCSKESNNGPEPSKSLVTENSDKIYEPGVTIIQFSDELANQVEEELKEGAKLPRTRSAEMSSVINKLGVKSLERLFPEDSRWEVRMRREGLHRWYVARFNEDEPLTRAVKEIEEIPGVEYVEKQLKIETKAFNDPKFSFQWGLNNEKLNYHNKKIDINVLPVWQEFTKGSSKVIISVVDEGIQMNHEDLKASIIAGGNGGSKNFVKKSYVIDPSNHATHVAGILGAINNNGIGVCGVAGGDSKKGISGVRIMSCEILNEETVQGKVVTKSALPGPAYIWAANNGAVISQNSWGYPADQNGDGKVTEEEKLALKNTKIPENLKFGIDYFIKYAGCDNDGNQLPDSPMKGGVVIFAAGNDALEYGPPANYEPVIAVGSVNNKGLKSDFSNYGSWVDIAAPGSSIYSTLSPNVYGNLSGTSMACPFVSGVAALVLSYRGGQGFTNEMLKDCLLKGADSTKITSSENIGPMLDALGAITYASEDFPKQADFTTNILSNNVDLSWKLTSSPKNIRAYGYELVAAKDKSLLKNLNLKSLPKNVIGKEILREEDAKTGSNMSGRIQGLDFDSNYYVAVIAFDYHRKYEGEYQIKQIHTGKNNPPSITIENSEAISLKAYQTANVKIKVSDPDEQVLTLKMLEEIQGVTLEKLKVNEYNLKIIAQDINPGSYNLSFIVSDGFGGEAKAKLGFVIQENQAPKVIEPIPNVLSNALGRSFQIDLSKYIQDPDGEQLTYEYEVSDPKIAHVAISGNTMTVTSISYGFTEIHISGVDIKNAKAELSLKLLVRANNVFMDVAPSPMTKEVQVRTGEKDEETNIKIVSSNGVEVYNENKVVSAFNPLTINVSKLAPGRYVIKVTYSGKTESKTIVKI